MKQKTNKAQQFLWSHWRHVLWFGPLAVLLLVLACNSYIEHSAEQRVYAELQDLPPKPVALVLGTAKTVNGRPNRFYTARIQAGADLYHANKVRHILVSGDNSRSDYDEPTAMKQDLVALGVPDEHITIDYAGFRTLDSIVRADQVFGQRSFVVVTQRFHGERALFLAQQHRLDAVAFTAADVSVSTGMKTYAREYLARVKAVLDVWVLRKQPKYLGESVPIDLSV